MKILIKLWLELPVYGEFGHSQILIHLNSLIQKLQFLLGTKEIRECELNLSSGVLLF